MDHEGDEPGLEVLQHSRNVLVSRKGGWEKAYNKIRHCRVNVLIVFSMIGLVVVLACNCEKNYNWMFYFIFFIFIYFLQGL